MCFKEFINSVDPVIMGRGKDYYESCRELIDRNPLPSFLALGDGVRRVICRTGA